MTPEARKKLFESYLKNADEETRDALLSALQEASDEEVLGYLQDAFTQTPPDSRVFSEAEKQKLFRHILRGKQTRRSTRLITAVAVAASLLLIAALGIWVFKGKRAEVPLLVRSGQGVEDILPGSNKATLSFSDGSSLELSEAKDGIILEENAVRYKDGTVISEMGKRAHSAETVTIKTPNGGQYQVTLPDGSKVWLNAASSLEYNSAFGPRSRRVALKGEAYFQVESDPSRPFYVESRGQRVEVTGTEFNINCYDNEPFIKTTLLEGSLKVVSGENQQAVRLRPGEQSILAPDQAFRINREHVDDAVAWKQGYFRFNQADINQVMRELSRWYDVPVRFQGQGSGEPLMFWGELYRNASFSEALEILSYFNLKYRVTYREGTKEVIVYQ